MLNQPAGNTAVCGVPGRKDRPFQHLHSMSDPWHDKQFLIYPGVKLGKFWKNLKHFYILFPLLFYQSCIPSLQKKMHLRHLRSFCRGYRRNKIYIFTTDIRDDQWVTTDNRNINEKPHNNRKTVITRFFIVWYTQELSGTELQMIRQ